MQSLIFFFIMSLSSIIPCSAQEYITLTEGPESNYFKINYRVHKGNVEFDYYYPGSGKSYPSIMVDMNKNGIVDNMLDRSYSFTFRGSELELCSQYLIDETRTTFCGEAPSKATTRLGLQRTDGTSFFKEFYIPIKELTPSSSNGIIHIRIQIANSMGTPGNETWVRTNYPECTNDPDCTRLFGKVYEIKVK